MNSLHFLDSGRPGLLAYEIRRILRSRCANLVKVFLWHISVQQDPCKEMQPLYLVISRCNDFKRVMRKYSIVFHSWFDLENRARVKAGVLKVARTLPEKKVWIRDFSGPYVAIPGSDVCSETKEYYLATWCSSRRSNPSKRGDGFFARGFKSDSPSECHQNKIILALYASGDWCSFKATGLSIFSQHKVIYTLEIQFDLQTSSRA